VVPHARRLLQAVEGTHQLKVCGVNEAGKLRAVDSLEECAVEEGILDIKLVHRRTPREPRVNTVRTVAGLMTGLKVSS
jgi:hypothetical protein